MDRVSSCNIYVIQQDTQCFMIKFIHNIWWLDMFRTSIVHPQERFQAVCCKFGTWQSAYYLTRPDVNAVARKTYEICNIKVVNTPEDGPLKSEICRATKSYEYTQSILFPSVSFLHRKNLYLHC